eukprot:786132-Rhodomonas_salina.2
MERLWKEQVVSGHVSDHVRKSTCVWSRGTEAGHVRGHVLAGGRQQPAEGGGGAQEAQGGCRGEGIESPYKSTLNRRTNLL